MTRQWVVLLGSALLLVSCAGVVPSPPTLAVTASPPAAPSAAPSPVPAGAAADADSVIKQSIPASYPRLVLASVPPGMAAHATVARGTYTLVYADDLHTKEISLTDEFGMNPPPPGPNGISAFRQFRGARSSYVVYDSTAPRSRRYLIWDEPGAWPKSTDGLPVNQFFLSGSGLTESEFFSAAGSLRPVG